jgi:hypothetical protein
MLNYQRVFWFIKQTVTHMVHFIACITCVFVSNGEYVANYQGEKELQTMVNWYESGISTFEIVQSWFVGRM